MDIETLNRKRKKIERDSVRFYNRLKKRAPEELEDEIRELDEKIFSRTNCLDCANCCKTISPVFKERDITRIAAHLRVKPSQMVQQYLHLDEDGDYIPKSIPCNFLGPDNKCSIYEVRPFACSSYPHTATLPLKKSWDLIAKNSAVCPVVNEITTILQKKYG